MGAAPRLKQLLPPSGGFQTVPACPSPGTRGQKLKEKTTEIIGSKQTVRSDAGKAKRERSQQHKTRLESCDWKQPPDLPGVNRTKPDGSGASPHPLCSPELSCTTSAASPSLESSMPLLSQLLSPPPSSAALQDHTPVASTACFFSFPTQQLEASAYTQSNLRTLSVGRDL